MTRALVGSLSLSSGAILIAVLSVSIVEVMGRKSLRSKRRT
jgi:hypothetical protein